MPVPTFVNAMVGVPVVCGLSWISPEKLVFVFSAPTWKVFIPEPPKPPRVAVDVDPDRLPNWTVGVAAPAVSIKPNVPLMSQEAEALPVFAALAGACPSDHIIPRVVAGSEKLPVKPLLFP